MCSLLQLHRNMSHEPFTNMPNPIWKKLNLTIMPRYTPGYLAREACSEYVVVANGVCGDLREVGLQMLGVVAKISLYLYLWGIIFHGVDRTSASNPCTCLINIIHFFPQYQLRCQEKCKRSKVDNGRRVDFTADTATL